MSRVLLFLGFTIVILTSGCLPNQMLTRSGALNTMSIDLEDENITYKQLSNSFEVYSFAGFMDTQADANFQSKSSTVINNNGIQTRTAVTRQANLLKFVTLFSSTLRMSALAWELFPNIQKGAFVIPSLVIALPLNDALWKPFNRQQVQGLTMNRLIGRSPNAHFYSFPNSNITEDASFFGTSWTGENYIVAGTISDQLIEGTGQFAPQTDAAKVDAPAQFPANEEESSGSVRPTESNEIAAFEIYDEGQQVLVPWEDKTELTGVVKKAGILYDGTPSYKVEFSYEGKVKTRWFSALVVKKFED